MTSPALILKLPHEVTSRLSDLGLEERALRQSVAKGVDGRHRATALHPPAFGGWMQYGETHRALREDLIPKGWKKDDTGMFSTVRSPDGRMAIAVALGDERTGLADGLPPRTKRPRGTLTHLAVHANQYRLDLWGEAAGAVLEPEETSGVVTWFLLVHPRHDEVRMELSCPSAIDDEGRIASWSERLLLAPLVTESTVPMVPEAPSADIDVPVRRIL